MGVVFFPSLPFMGVMLFLSFVLGNRPERVVHFLCHFLYFLFLFLFLSFLLFLLLFYSLFLPFFFSSTSHSPFSLSFCTNSFHPFFLLLLFSTSLFFFFSFPPLCSSSLYFHLIFLSSFLLEGFFFLREPLVLCTSEV